MSLVHHALVLNLHQPAGNLEHLLAHEPWVALDQLPPPAEFLALIGAPPTPA